MFMHTQIKLRGFYTNTSAHIGFYFTQSCTLQGHLFAAAGTGGGAGGAAAGGWCQHPQPANLNQPKAKRQL